MRFVMVSMPHMLKLLWACSIVLQIGLLVLLVARKHYRNYPAISAYLLISLLQSPVVYAFYSWWGYESPLAYRAAWSSQIIVVASRALVVCGICYQILAQYRGIWGMTWRILVVTAAGVLTVGLVVGRHDFVRMVSTVDLGLECSIAVVLTVFFLFARYYHIQIAASHRFMGIAFCLYSCFRALNDAVLQTFLREYSLTWNVVDEVTFLATLVLLTRAAFGLQLSPDRKVVLLPGAVYASLIPQVNKRLSALNERLGQLLKSETDTV